MKNSLIVLAGLVVILVSCGFAFPAVAKLQAFGLLSTGMLLVIGVLFALAGIGLAIYGIKRTAAFMTRSR